MNKLPRRALVAATSSVFAAALCVGTATSAQATSSPSCVTAKVTDNNHDVVVYNYCPTRQRVKVIWAFAGDSACQLLESVSTDVVNARFRDYRSYPGHFDGLQTC